MNTRRLASRSLLSLQVADESILTSVVESLVPELETLKQRLESHTLGLPIIPEPPLFDSPDIIHVDNCLRIIETSLLRAEHASFTRDTLFSQKSSIASGLVPALIACEALQQTAASLNTSCGSSI